VEEMTELGAVSSDPISSLSHGFRQRVGIAQALVHRPRLLILDEPITGLDPVQIVEMRELLRSLKGDHTILLSSHILSEISETCDRILVIKDGQIAAAGTESELTSRLRKGGFRADFSVGAEGEGGGGRARAAIEGMAGVTSVELVTQAEPGALTLRVEAEHDVRADVCRELVKAGLDILQVGAGERVLESVFLELAGPGGDAEEIAARAKK